MSDQVTITVHRRLRDGTWPPGEEPPEGRMLLVMLRSRWGNHEHQMHGFIRMGRFETDDGGYYDGADILAWADVTDVFAGGREAKQ